MLHLIIMMIERVGIIVILGFVLAHVKGFRNLLLHNQGFRKKAILVFIFASFSIISNYTGIEIQQQIVMNHEFSYHLGSSSSIANTRIMGIEMGGLIGGPFVGIGAGLLAGIHRYSLGGSTALSCAISSILAGVIAGYVGSRFKRRNRMVTPRQAALFGVAMESLQMIIILLFARPFADAWGLVSIIALPMIFVNGIGSFIFLSILQSVIRQEEQAKAMQTHRVFSIADQTLPFSAKG